MHTFVICAYKESPYLGECISSLLKQTVKSRILIATSTPNEYITRTAAEYEIPEETPAEEHLLRGHAWDIWDKADAEGLTLAEAKDAYVETLEGWGALTDAEKQAENEWFGWAVAPYDKGLQYARQTRDRALFESLLARL